MKVVAGQVSNIIFNSHLECFTCMGKAHFKMMTKLFLNSTALATVLNDIIDEVKRGILYGGFNTWVF